LEHQHQRKVIVKMTETTISISKYKIPILTGIDNYYEWKSATQDAILAMGALEVITLDKKEKPKVLASEGMMSTRTGCGRHCNFSRGQPIPPNCQEIPILEDRDQRVMGVLRMEVEKCTCTKEIWDKLVQIHQLRNCMDLV
jgi:hypothetical protein